MPANPLEVEDAFASSTTLGADLRALRKARGLSLAELALAVGRSVGWLSQVERDITQPSVEDLRIMAEQLGVSLSILFGQAATPAEEQGYVVRSRARRRIGEAGGLIEELLSPDLTDSFEVIHSTFEPGSALEEPNQRPTQELGYVISGRLDVCIGSRRFTVGPGDSFRIRRERYSWANPYDVPAVVVWIIAPPVY